MLNKLNKIWLKGPNSHIFKDDGLDWSKILKQHQNFKKRPILNFTEI